PWSKRSFLSQTLTGDQLKDLLSFFSSSPEMLDGEKIMARGHFDVSAKVSISQLSENLEHIKKELQKKKSGENDAEKVQARGFFKDAFSAVGQAADLGLIFG